MTIISFFAVTHTHGLGCPSLRIFPLQFCGDRNVAAPTVGMPAASDAATGYRSFNLPVDRPLFLNHKVATVLRRTTKFYQIPCNEFCQTSLHTSPTHPQQVHQRRHTHPRMLCNCRKYSATYSAIYSAIYCATYCATYCANLVVCQKYRMNRQNESRISTVVICQEYRFWRSIVNADDDVSPAPVVDIIRECANRMENLLRIPSLLVFDPRTFHLALANQVFDVNRQSHLRIFYQIRRMKCRPNITRRVCRACKHGA